ncbi:hypothetical protein TSOC_014602, partial [Tetrabaena socialis]
MHRSPAALLGAALGSPHAAAAALLLRPQTRLPQPPDPATAHALMSVSSATPAPAPASWALSRLDPGSCPREVADRCQDVISQAFVAEPSTQLYLSDPAAHGLRFWRTMVSEIMRALPGPGLPLYALVAAAGTEAAGLEATPLVAAAGAEAAGAEAAEVGAAPLLAAASSTAATEVAEVAEAAEVVEVAEQGAAEVTEPGSAPPQGVAAAALAYTWHPGLAYGMPLTEAMVRPEAAAAWDECGTLWHALLLDTHDRYGPFQNVDFIGVCPCLASAGLGRRLLDALLRDADARGHASFLAACGRRNRVWYGRHGYELLHEYRCCVAGLAGHSELHFMVRPPLGRGGGGGGGGG